MTRKSRLASALLILLCPACQSAKPSTAPPLTRYQFTEPKWGSVFRIILYAPDEAAANAAATAAFKRIDEIGHASNDYDPNSELSLLSRKTFDAPMPAPVPVSEDLYHVLRASIEASEQSCGAFDVTVGPLVHLWRRSRELGALPTPERLATARAGVGYRKLKLARTASSPTAQLTAAKMRLDLGGIVTGYATTEVLRVLKDHGIRSALIDAAGDLAASDPPPGRDAWRVAIQAIDEPSKRIGYVKLANRAVSTSGDTYRYVEIDGVRYSHIVDPKTGLGLTRRVGATVIADDGMTADWLDTALPVMEMKEAQALVERTPGAAARITTVGADGSIAVWESSRFPRFWDKSVVSPDDPSSTDKPAEPSPAKTE